MMKIPYKISQFIAGNLDGKRQLNNTGTTFQYRCESKGNFVSHWITCSWVCCHN